MKKKTQHLMLVIFLATILVYSCGQANQPTEASKTSGPKDSIPEDPIPAEAKHLDTVLQKLSPYTFDQLLKILPPKLLEANATDIGAKENLGAAFASARYVVNDSTNLSIEIFDCAGTAGAGVYKQQYLSLFLPDNSPNGKTIKKEAFQGSTSFLENVKQSNEDVFTFLAKKRLLISLTGKGIDPTFLKETADHLQYPN